MRTLYYSRIYLLYDIYGVVPIRNIHRNCLLQENAMRFMLYTTYNTQSMPLFNNQVYKRYTRHVQDMYNLQLGVLMYKFTIQELPRSLMPLYEYSTTPHDTRHGQDPILPKYTTNLVRRTFLYRGFDMWRKLADAVKSSRLVAGIQKCDNQIPACAM